MRRALVGIGVFVLVACCVLSVTGAFFYGNQATAFLESLAPSSPTEGTATPRSPATVQAPVRTSTPPQSNATLDELVQETIPANNPFDLTARLRDRREDAATPASVHPYQIGDQDRFWMSREITGTYELITASLRYVTPHSYMWVEDGLKVSDAEVRSAGNSFENRVYPTDRRYFGEEPNPGVDNDPHVFILNTSFRGALGYYSSADEYPTTVNRYSNRHEMFYMNVTRLRPGTTEYTSVLAHEFTHMIHWNNNRQEGSWITEGMGELAMKLNGFPQSTVSYSQNPDIQLNAWAASGQGQIPHYAASYLFLSYLLNRFGEAIIRDMIASQTRDIDTVQRALDQVAPGYWFDDVFGDWVAASYVNDKSLGPRYSYLDQALGIKPTHQYSSFPVTANGQVHQYGADYVDLRTGGQSLTATFDGDRVVKIIPTDPHSGKYLWWGNRLDQSDTRLTREFDLTAVKRATLQFWTWYDIESEFDYAYVEVSTDGGKDWKTLGGGTTTIRDPNAANYGSGLTCKSGLGCGENAAPADWTFEQMDLTPYAGSKVLVRFEYVTDAIYSAPGIAIDDISVPELNYSDDVEHGNGGWEAEGFARIDNLLPQRFLVQAVAYDKNGRVTQVVPVALDSANHGVLSTKTLGNPDHVVLIISASTPITWEEAAFRLSIQ